MKAANTIQAILKHCRKHPATETATCFAPVNIALVKYWGKRDTELNLPVTNSFSVALPNKGTTTTLRVNSLTHDRYQLNSQHMEEGSEFSKRLNQFCSYFRFSNHYHFDIHTENNIPTAAGLASSASGFAALVLAFDKLFDWQLEQSQLSILARLGSGSACRSLWNGFVEWQKGDRVDGLDCFATPYLANESFLKSLSVGLLIFESGKKPISSRQAMLNTVTTSPSYRNWPLQVDEDLRAVKTAIAQENFMQLGEVAERNALAMHATMLDSQPKTDFCTEKTYEYRKKIRLLRQSGVPVYFTQDAGPNLKLLFQKPALSILKEHFPEIETINLG